MAGLLTAVRLPLLFMVLVGAFAAACNPRQDHPQEGMIAQPEADGGVTVAVCEEPVAFPAPPERVITHGMNITEMFVALGLGSRLVAYGGVRDDSQLLPETRAQLAAVPNLSAQTMSLETILGTGADFVFSGWAYGFRDGQVTPSRLQEFGIASYVLTESCIRKMQRERVSLEDTFQDMLNLGQIFGVENEVQRLVDTQRSRLRTVADALEGLAERPTVFLYDSGTDMPVTAGRYAMAHAIMDRAGGQNIFADLNSSWTTANWEAVIDRDPDWIIIGNYGYPDAEGKTAYLLNTPQFSHLRAVQERRFVYLDFNEVTPSSRNIVAVETLAHAMHPDRFATVRSP